MSTKIKTYVLMLSEVFPKTHNKAGMPTLFKRKFLNGDKLHTIRANYPLWEKRIKEVQDGQAVLSIRQWTGKPYCSKQVEIARLTAENGVGIQKLCIVRETYNSKQLWLGYVEGKQGEYNFFNVLSNNDGLTFYDWFDWFREYNLSQPLAIIHFTKFRY